MDDAEDLRLVREWYYKLDSRIVDLVGDFVGDELFIIEGDSLLLHCFSNPKLNFDPGFQVLHATYLVEQVLAKLQQRRCVFEVVFFAQNAQSCIPPGSNKDSHEKYLLAREAIIQHLISTCAQTSQSFQALRFESLQSEQFNAHLISSGAYLFMCHDGAYTERTKSAVSSDSDSSDWSGSDSDESELEDHRDASGSTRGETSQLKFRAMIRWFANRGYNTALINSLEFRDTKVMAMIIECSTENTKQDLSLSDNSKPIDSTSLDCKNIDWSDQNLSLDCLNDALSELRLNENGDQAETALESTETVSLGQEKLHHLLEQAVSDQPTITQRQCLAIVTLSAMFLGGVPETSANKAGAQSMLLHLVYLQETQISERGVKYQGLEKLQFFKGFMRTARALLGSTVWAQAMIDHRLPCDLSDLLDGTLFLGIQTMIEEHGLESILSPATALPFNNLASLVDRLGGTTLQCQENSTAKPGHVDNSNDKTKKTPTSEAQSQSIGRVLPFSNAVFDKHLQPVHLTVDESFEPKNGAKSTKDHGQSSKPLESKGKVILTPQELQRARRRNQFFMSEMESYAASLTGSSRPETIVVESARTSNQKSHQKPHQKPTVDADSTKSSNSKKKGQNKSGKPSVREIAAASIQQKATESTQKQRQKWKLMYQEEFSRIVDLETRFTRLSGYLSSLSKEARVILEAEVLICMVDTLVRLVFFEREGLQPSRLTFLAMRIWEIITWLMKLKEGISADIVTYVDAVCRLFALPPARLSVQCKEPLTCQLFKIPAGWSMNIGMSPVEFQLSHGGPFMERSIYSKPDPRTPDFDPDHWQRDVLDQIDEKKSVFIVAPTSAGKTFISFYAMRQILKEDDDGIIVYVAPTKALVNQIAAEVLARFSKSYPAKVTGKSVWSIHTRDYHINEPKGCQILITVPHILQTMLLSPTNASAWTPRIKRIIFDEIHCIGQAEDGVVWEQLLLMSPCPIVALSATVGNPHKFYDWLHLAQKANGLDMKMIQHKHRYSDLRKYVYEPPKTFSFKGFPSRVGLPRLGLDEANDMAFIHPVTSLVDRSRSMPDDLDLEPRDCLTLWKAMHDLRTEQFPVDASLDPSTVFSGTAIKKIDVFEWQKQLKSLLGDWMKDPKSPFEELMLRLANTATKATAESQSTSNETSMTVIPEARYTTLPLIFSLHSQGALPALFFNYDRTECEELCHELLEQLQDSEAKWKAESPAWKTKIAKWEEWKVHQENAKKKSTKVTKKKTAGNENGDETSRADQVKDSASVESSQFDRFDPERPLDEFNLADPKKVGPEEFSEFSRELERRYVPKWLIDALGRGIGVHHAGMNRKYRNICEILFRRGFLRVVFATGTLALGINMPCKTVVFSGDSIFLTALNFRQAAGRAGRRGFDTLGNVVFQHVPPSKMHRLISSKLPDLSGHFPITTDLVLRLFILLHGSKQAPSAVKSINSIMSSPQIFLGGPEMKETVLHHLRFSIEYLRRNSLLDKTGMPLNFAACISHLYYTENSSFAFHALLTSGYLQELCKDIHSAPKKTVRSLMLVMAHIFRRIPLRQATLEWYQTAEKKPSSVVALPKMPKKAISALRNHNKKVLGIYKGYVSTFVEQHVQDPDCYLPFSGVKCGGGSSVSQLGSLDLNPISPKITSPFYALSANSDSFKTVSDLCEMVRSGVWLEESVIPYVAASPEENPGPLNAYLFDFFKHGNVSQLESANRIRRGDIWFLLNDFSLILATITASLDLFLDPSGKSSGDILNVVGGGDAHETQVENQKADDKIEAMSQGKNNSEFNQATPAPPRVNLRTAKPADSWEDEMDEESDDDDEEPSGRQRSNKGSKLQKEKPIDNSQESMTLVSQAFKELQKEFDDKFKAMWA